MIHRFEKILEDQVRPALAAHGGNVEIVDFDNDILYLRLMGGCQGCSSSKATVKQGIENLIKQNFPSVKEVVDVTDHESGDNPYYKNQS